MLRPSTHRLLEVHVMKRVSFLLLIVLCLFIAGCEGMDCDPETGGSYAVSGRITKVNEPQEGIEGVTIAFSGGYGTATTDSNGYWTKSGLKGTVTATPAKPGYLFDPDCITASGPSNAINFEYAVEPTAEQMEEFNATTQMLSNRVADLYDPDRPSAVFAAIADEARALAVVEHAAGDETGLYIKYRDGGLVMWLNSLPRTKPVWMTTDVQDLSTMSSVDTQYVTGLLKPGNKRAAIVNCLADDPNFDWEVPIFKSVEQSLTSLGYEVERIDGEAATRKFFKAIGDYGVVVVNGHGGITDWWNKVEWQTGEPWHMHQISINWMFGKEDVMHVPWGKGDSKTRMRNQRAFWTISSKSLKETSFDDSIVIAIDCYGFANSSMADTVIGNGGIAYVGWTDVARISSSTSSALISLMARGDTLSEAVENLPPGAAVDKIIIEGRTITSYLKYRTRNEGPVTLLSGKSGYLTPPTVSIDYPSPGTVTSAHDIRIGGTILPLPFIPARGDRATVSVGDLMLSLQVNEADGSFEKVVPLKSGSNIISVFGLVNGVSDCVKVSVTASYDTPDLWTGLVWDTGGTDLDLHLVPKGKERSSEHDCCWHNKTTDWGGVLDFDDTDGFGPEHITAEDIDPGTYELWVYFYSSSISEPTNADVYIRTRGQPLRHFERSNLAVRSWWPVAEITFPDGSIESIEGDAGLFEALTYPKK